MELLKNYLSGISLANANILILSKDKSFSKFVCERLTKVENSTVYIRPTAAFDDQLSASMDLIILDNSISFIENNSIFPDLVKSGTVLISINCKPPFEMEGHIRSEYQTDNLFVSIDRPKKIIRPVEYFEIEKIEGSIFFFLGEVKKDFCAVDFGDTCKDVPLMLQQAYALAMRMHKKIPKDQLLTCLVKDVQIKEVLNVDMYSVNPIGTLCEMLRLINIKFENARSSNRTYLVLTKIRICALIANKMSAVLLENFSEREIYSALWIK